MKFIIIITTLVAWCFAAPSLDLQHPSPINPSVLVEIKPQEKVVLITDPLEIAKFKREINQPLYPTVLPEDHPHHIAKRDHKPGHEIKPANKPNTPTLPKKSPPSPPTTTKKPAQKPYREPPKKPSSNKRNRRNVETYQKPQIAFQKPLILPATLAPETNPIGFQKPQTLPLILPATMAPETSSTGFQKPQTLPAILPHDTLETTHPIKRDIPVPLVPKYQHPEVSPKDSSEKKSDEDIKEDTKVKSDEDSKDKKEPKIDHIEDGNHQNKNEVKVEDLSEPKPFHQTLPLNHDIPTHAATTDDEKKSNISDAHNLIRPKPVPVAELFARAHDD